MRKIETLFERIKGSPLVKAVVTQGCEWVLEGAGIATEKFDGTCCAIIGGRLYKRHALKQNKTVPKEWLHWSFNPEQKSGHGWSPVSPTDSSDQYHREAGNLLNESLVLEDGTYELVGPKIQKNPYNLERHELWQHGSTRPGSITPIEWKPFSTSINGKLDIEYELGALRDYLAKRDMEGLVFHHPNGQMAKVKRRDFGFPWPCGK